MAAAAELPFDKGCWERVQANGIEFYVLPAYTSFAEKALALLEEIKPVLSGIGRDISMTIVEIPSVVKYIVNSPKDRAFISEDILPSFSEDALQRKLVQTILASSIQKDREEGKRKGVCLYLEWYVISELKGLHIMNEEVEKFQILHEYSSMYLRSDKATEAQKDKLRENANKVRDFLYKKGALPDPLFNETVDVALKLWDKGKRYGYKEMALEVVDVISNGTLPPIHLDLPGGEDELWYA